MGFTLVLTARLVLAWAHAKSQLNLRLDSMSAPPFFGVSQVAFVPSAASAMNNVIIKVLLHGLLSWPRLSMLPLVGAFVGTAFLQVWSTTIGVQLYDMLTYVPVQVSEQILVTVVYGAIFFEEAPSCPLSFFAFTGAIVLGVLMSQSRTQDQDPEG